MTTQELIRELISVGKTETYERLPSIIATSPEHCSGQFMRQSRAFWTDLGMSLSDGDIVALIKCLTVAERDLPNLKAGSVSPVIWLYGLLRERTHNDYKDIEEWILQRTDNDYLPWGHSNHGARSLAEYHRFSEQLAKRKRERQEREHTRQNEARKRIAEKATHDLFGALKRKDIGAIVALRRKGADPHALNSEGKSALDIANALGNEAILHALTSILEERS